MGTETERGNFHFVTYVGYWNLKFSSVASSILFFPRSQSVSCFLTNQSQESICSRFFSFPLQFVIVFMFAFHFSLLHDWILFLSFSLFASIPHCFFTWTLFEQSFLFKSHHHHHPYQSVSIIQCNTFFLFRNCHFPKVGCVSNPFFFFHFLSFSLFLILLSSSFLSPFKAF